MHPCGCGSRLGKGMHARTGVRIARPIRHLASNSAPPVGSAGACQHADGRVREAASSILHACMCALAHAAMFE